MGILPTEAQTRTKRTNIKHIGQYFLKIKCVSFILIAKVNIKEYFKIQKYKEGNKYP